MVFLDLKSDLITISIILVAALVIIFLSIYLYKRNINVRKYKKIYKYMNKQKEKKFNANVLIDSLFNHYSTDNSNTYSTLKSKGKQKVKRYYKFYQDELNKLVEAKSNITPNKKQNKLIFVFKNSKNDVVGKYYIKDNFKKLKKQIDKHQLLFDIIAYLYELPQYIDQLKPYELENHDNKNIISYRIVENPKK